MFRRLINKLIRSALIKLVCAALKPVPVLGIAAQVVAFAL
jgi:hypothetical protein